MLQLLIITAITIFVKGENYKNLHFLCPAQIRHKALYINTLEKNAAARLKNLVIRGHIKYKTEDIGKRTV